MTEKQTEMIERLRSKVLIICPGCSYIDPSINFKDVDDHGTVMCPACGGIMIRESMENAFFENILLIKKSRDKLEEENHRLKIQDEILVSNLREFQKELRRLHSIYCEPFGYYGHVQNDDDHPPIVVKRLCNLFSSLFFDVNEEEGRLE
jgi:hypothetical protein